MNDETWVIQKPDARLAEIRRRIAQLQIHTQKLLRGAHTGQYITRRIGTGSEFDQLRDYQVGDNVRAIDWKSSARSNKLIVRSYREDRNRTIILLVDTSRSALFGSGENLKQQVIQDLAVMLSFAAEQARDRIGAVFFGHTVEKVVPLGAGKVHSASLVQEILSQAPLTTKETSLSVALATTLEQFSPNALVVLISDCLSSGYETALASVAQRHEVAILRVYDPVEREMPEGILVQCQDPETGATVPATDLYTMSALRAFVKNWYVEQDLLFKKLGIAWCDINVQSSYDVQLTQFFAQRCV